MKRNKPTDVFKSIDMHGGDKTVCWEWTRPLGKDGRPYFDLKGKKHLAYRVTYTLVFGEIPEGMLFRHTCDNGACCNPWHGVLGTHQQNMDDMKSRERHGLPHHTVRRIRIRLARGDKQKDIAADFGLNPELVSKIHNGTLYSHVHDAIDNSE